MTRVEWGTILVSFLMLIGVGFFTGNPLLGLGVSFIPLLVSTFLFF